MICASMMLAVFLAWPLVFTGKGSPSIAAAGARAVAEVQAAASEARLIQVADAKPAAATSGPPESCYNRYQREIAQCRSGAVAACKLDVADKWDLCEATGFWPAE